MSGPDFNREYGPTGLWADDTTFADNMQTDLTPMLFEALQRMYDRYCVVIEKPEHFEYFIGMIISGGLAAFNNQLKRLEKELDIT